MRITLCLAAAATLAACASSSELARRSEMHLQQSQQYARAGDTHRAITEEKRGARLYQKAAARAYEEERPVPPPPLTPPPYPDAIHY